MSFRRRGSLKLGSGGVRVLKLGSTLLFCIYGVRLWSWLLFRVRSCFLLIFRIAVALSVASPLHMEMVYLIDKLISAFLLRYAIAYFHCFLQLLIAVQNALGGNRLTRGVKPRRGVTVSGLVRAHRVAKFFGEFLLTG